MFYLLDWHGFSASQYLISLSLFKEVITNVFKSIWIQLMNFICIIAGPLCIAIKHFPFLPWLIYMKSAGISDSRLSCRQPVLLQNHRREFKLQQRKSWATTKQEQLFTVYKTLAILNTLYQKTSSTQDSGGCDNAVGPLPICRQFRTAAFVTQCRWVNTHTRSP